jgi:hypothetical protein
MIRDLGFEIVSEMRIDNLLAASTRDDQGEGLKGLEELRPFQQKDESG